MRYTKRYTVPARARWAATAVLAAGALAACGGTDANTPAAAAEAVTVTDAWVVATDADMTAVFGVIENDADTAVVIIEAASETARMELHEIVAHGGDHVMQEIDGGFTIPAEGERPLEPGGDHLMLMDLAQPIIAGDVVAVTLVFDDGSELEFTAVAKDFAGGAEEYVPHDGHE